MSVLVSIAVANGATHLVEDSSGNAGAAAAAYAARAGITCTVYAPESAPAAKLRQIRAYGADLIAVPGPRSAVADAARLAGTRPGGYHVSHNDNPLFTIGNQSLAFEIAEARAAIDDRTLDDPSATRPWHVVMPVGGGALLCGVAEGFTLRGAERNSPLLHGAQTTACAPLAEAYRAGSRDPSPIARRPTVCGGIEIEQPARGRQILEAVRATGGSIVANDDTEILAARDAIATLEGIYIEPTSAAGVAAVALLAHQAKIAPDDLVVLILTGSGLKDPGPIPR